MSTTDTEADAVLDAVLAGAQGTAKTPAALEGDIVETGTAVAADENTQPTCTIDEARAMTDRLRASLAEFDYTLNEALRTRAWKRLGYDTPKDYVLTELGPAKDGDQDGRVSRAHAYRLARCAVLLYELSRRIGDEAYSIDLTERGLRSIPAKYDGVMLDRMDNAVRAAGDNLDPVRAQEIVDGEISRARRELDETNELSDGSAPTSTAGEALAGMGVSDDDFTDDLTSSTSAPADTPDTGAPTETTAWEGDQGSTSRDDMRAAFTVEAASEDAVGAAATLRDLLALFRRAPEFDEHLPQILDSATDTEISDLLDQAEAAAGVIEKLRSAAENAL